MNDTIINFPHQRSIHTFDMKDLKSITRQVALKSCMAQLDPDTSDYLKSVVFGKWSILRDATENAAFTFSSFFPMDTEKPLVSSAMASAAEAYINDSARNIDDRPVAYMDALITTLARHTEWQASGVSTDRRRSMAWAGASQPLPVWLRRNDLYTLEFSKNTRVCDFSCSRDLILASKLIPEGGHPLLDRIIAKRFGLRRGNGHE